MQRLRRKGKTSDPRILVSTVANRRLLWRAMHLGDGLERFGMFNTTSTLILVLLFLIIVYLLFRQRWYVRILLLLVVVGGLTSIALGLDRLLDEGKENDIAGALLVGFGLLGVVLSVKETERKQREGN